MLNNGPSALDALKIRSNLTLLRTRAFVAGGWHGSGATAVVDPAGDGKFADVDDCDLPPLRGDRAGPERDVSLQQHQTGNTPLFLHGESQHGDACADPLLL
ncbi:hypothetical protein [Sinorhizobium fredii]|uniref:hypothetical protein n=1 Tax=Rhizobium fredii TaxID=380 RepID=UPI0012FE5BD7|nr:hypothetical protein [Sinorhizobium fredii]